MKYIALVTYNNDGYSYIGPDDDLKAIIESAKVDFAENDDITSIYVEDCVDGMPDNVGNDPYWMVMR